MSRAGVVVAAAFAACVLAGCRHAPEEAETAPRLETRLDEIQAQLMSMQQQIASIQTPPPVTVQESPLVLRPVVPEEPVEQAPSKREQIERLARRTPSRSAATASSGSAKADALAKKHIRVPVSVRVIQSALRNAGMNPGTVDGKVGERTIAAIRAFQKREGLAQDGVVGPATWRRLQSFSGSLK